ncbi:MAG TPA: DNA-binding protein [Thermoanaerobaculia bacterium]|nr:DNA-binding protein [Thermoanaerobaculia bacterium]
MSTVQRWEKREGMPVHRHLHDKLGTVYAFPAELDAWSRSRQLQLSARDTPATAPAGRTRRWLRLAAWVGTMTLVIALLALLDRTERFGQKPLSDARFVRLTHFEGMENAAAISRDGRFVAFLSDRDGQPDVWVTQVGSGQFHNLTAGRIHELVNPDVRTIGFSPDATLVTFWRRRDDAQIDTWAIPTLGGEPRLYLGGTAEFDWSSDGTRLVYHTSDPGDPLFVNDHTRRAERRIFTARPGVHNHFPLWSPDHDFIYFVHGSVPGETDIWRIDPEGGAPERLTSHNSRVSHPVFLNRRTLLYLAADGDSGPWLYAADVERRTTRRVSFGVERYTSLAGSADARRLVATVNHSRRTLWRVPITGGVSGEQAASRANIPTTGGRAPRIGPSFLVYVASRGDAEGIWKLAGGAATELWSVPGARVLGGPAISPDGRRIAFAAENRGVPRLYLMDADGSRVTMFAESLHPRGTPAWTPDGRALAVGAMIDGAPCLAKVSVNDRRIERLVSEFAADPAWSRDGTSLVYSGPDIGTTFPLHAVSATGRPLTAPGIRLSRGARRVAFLGSENAVVVLRGDLNHKNFWVIGLGSGRERQLTNFGRDGVIGDFDVAFDGSEIIFDREQDNSDVVLIDR